MICYVLKEKKHCFSSRIQEPRGGRIETAATFATTDSFWLFYSFQQLNVYFKEPGAGAIELFVFEPNY